MNYSTFRFTLDMHKHQSQISIPVMRGDTAVRLYITLTDGGKPYTIGASCFAIAIGNKPDGCTFRHPCIIEGDGSVIRYDFQPDTSNISGATLTEVRLYGTNGILTAPCFTIAVDERIPHYDETVTEEVTDALDQVFSNEAVRVAAEDERAKADKARWEYFASLYYPALDGIIALQDGLIGRQALYKLNADEASYTCIGGLNIEKIVIADYVNDKPVTAIAPYAFKDYDKLRIINIPKSIATIGKDAFTGCTALETVYYDAINATDSEYKDSPFKHCGFNSPSGTAVVIGKDVVRIPKNLFNTNGGTEEMLNNVTSLTFEEGSVCEVVDDYAFHNCRNMEGVVEIPGSVTYLNKHSFRNIKATSVTFGENSKLYKIASSVFMGLPIITEISLPSSVKEISNNAFKDCTSLERATFTGKPTSVVDSMFLGCEALTDIYVPWAEGEVMGAPWGAPYATTHYNSEV